MMKHERTEDTKIVNHFQTELADIESYEYNDTLAGINMVVPVLKQNDSRCFEMKEFWYSGLSMPISLDSEYKK